MEPEKRKGAKSVMEAEDCDAARLSSGVLRGR